MKLICPNKSSGAWKLLESQVGEYKAYATWAYNGFDFPANLKTDSQLKKELGVRNKVSDKEFIRALKRIKEYNKKNGTSHSISKEVIGESNTYEVTLHPSYLSVENMAKLLSEKPSIIKDLQAKSFYNNYPKHYYTKIGEGQYEYNGDIFPSTENAVDDLPNTVIGNNKQISKKFQDVIDRYLSRVKTLRNTIKNLEVRKIKATAQERAELDKAIQKLRDKINTIVGDDTDLESVNNSLVTKITKLNAIESIEPYANIQLDELEQIFSQDNVSREELEYAKKVADLWIRAGDFSGKVDNLFFDADELEAADTDLAPIKAKFIGWKDRAESIYRRFIIPIEEDIAKETIANTFGLDIENFTGSIPDVNYVKSQVLDISEVDNPLLQAMHTLMSKASFYAHEEASEIVKAIDEALDKVGKVDWELFQQTWSNEDKRLTGDIVFRFTQKYFTDIKEVFDKAKFAKEDYKATAWKTALNKLRESTIIMDLRALFPEESWNTPLTAKERDAHIQLLKDTLGEKGYDEYYKKAKEKLEVYKLDRKAFISNLESEGLADNEMAIQLSSWEANNSPEKEVNMFNEGYDSTKIAGKYINPSGKYSIKIPRRVIDGKDTGFYDKKFEAIESNDNLLELYNYLFKTLNELKHYLPDSDVNWMHVNSLPTMALSLMEEYRKDKVTAGITPIWDKLKEASRTSDTPSTTSADVNILTGEADKRLQLQYVHDYYQKISNLVKVKEVEYIQQNGTEPTMEQKIKFRKDIADQLAREKSFDLAKVTKSFALMSLGYKHKASIQDFMMAANSILNRQLEQQTNAAGVELKDRHGRLLNKQGLPNLKSMLDTLMDAYWGYSLDKPIGKTTTKVLTSKEKELYNLLDTVKKQNDDDFATNKIDEETYNTRKALIDDQLETLGGVKTWSKYGDILLQYVQLKGMGWNGFAAISNMMYGFISNVVEASDGRNYTTQNFWRAQAKVLNTVAGYNKFSKDGKKISTLMKKWDILKDSRYELYKDTVTGMGKTLKGAKKVIDPMNPQTSTEFLNQATVMLAMMYNTKVNLNGEEVDLYEALDDDGNLKEGVEFDVAKFVVKVNKIIKMNHGNYDPNSPISIKRTVWGRALSQFRTWGFQGFAERFMGEMTDYELGITRKGRYRSYGAYYTAQKDNGVGYINATFGLTKQLLRKATFGAYNTTFDEIEGLSEVDAANLRKNLTEIMIFAIITALVHGLKAAFEDDDDEAKLQAFFWINQLNRLNTDMAFYTSPIQFEKLQRNALPVFTAVIDMEKALNASWVYIFDNASDTYKRGRNKDKSKAGVAWGKLFPSPMNAIDKIEASTQMIYSDKPSN